MHSGQGQSSVCIFRMDLLMAACSFPTPRCSWEVENDSSFQGNASWGSLWPVLLLGAALRRGLGAADRVTCSDGLLRLTEGICSLTRENPSGNVVLGWHWRHQVWKHPIVFQEVLLSHPHFPIPHILGHLCSLQGSKGHSQGLDTQTVVPALPVAPVIPLFLLFKVNLSDCHNVIVFLAPSVVSQSLTPGVVLGQLEGVFLGKRGDLGWNKAKQALLWVSGLVLHGIWI